MRHMNICSISLIIREKDIKTTMRYHFTRVRTAIIKNSTKKKKNTGEGVVKMELIYSVGEMNVGTVIIENGMEAP